VAKFHAVVPHGFKVIVADRPMLNFKPILTMLSKNCWETCVPSGACTSGFWSLFSTCRNLRVQHPLGVVIWFSEKVGMI